MDVQPHKPKNLDSTSGLLHSIKQNTEIFPGSTKGVNVYPKDMDSITRFLCFLLNKTNSELLADLPVERFTEVGIMKPLIHSKKVDLNPTFYLVPPLQSDSYLQINGRYRLYECLRKCSQNFKIWTV